MRLPLSRILLIIIVGTFVLSAFLAPLAYEVIINSFGFRKWPFSRIFDRIAMLVVVVLVLCFRKSFSLNPLINFLRQGSWSFRFRCLFIGFIISLGASALVFPIFVWSGQLAWLNMQVSEMFLKVIGFAPAAFLVSLIEEGFFRAMIFNGFRQRSPLMQAALASSLLYAFAHFIVPDKDFIYPGYSLFVGFDYLAAVLRRMVLPGTWQVFIGFTLIGMVLALVLNAVRSLYLCIGLHAGWVVALKLLNDATDLAHPTIAATGIGARYFLLSQPYAWMSILLVLSISLLLRDRLQSKQMQIT